MSTPQTVFVFNNLTRQKEEFKPQAPGQVKFYSCGPTTYDFAHVGNARAFVVGDLIHRVFKALGYKVTFTRNFTDVDDKIIERAKQLGVPPLEHAEKFVQECLKDWASLGMLPPTYTPKVSETMPEIIQMIEDLIKNGYGYVVEGGEVLYHVPKFKDYGKLSKKDLDGLQAGIRVEVDSHKKHPSDFVLWKPTKPGEEAVWDSPWGKGRPGWHIECSAMAKKLMGKTIDIHHGGVDLMFPHHENEIAQSEAANGCGFCAHWVHNEFLNFGSEKMSKSLGNVVTIRQFVEKYSGLILRQVLCTAHYRSKMDWTEEVIERAMGDVERLHTFLVKFESDKKGLRPGGSTAGADELKGVLASMKHDLAQDFNVPGAMSHFFGVVRLYNRISEKSTPDKSIMACIQEIVDFTRLSTGLLGDDPAQVLKDLKATRERLSGPAGKIPAAEIEKLIAARKEARAKKDWAAADKARDALTAAGVVVKDNPDGTVTWTYK